MMYDIVEGEEEFHVISRHRADALATRSDYNQFFLSNGITTLRERKWRLLPEEPELGTGSDY